MNVNTNLPQGSFIPWSLMAPTAQSKPVADIANQPKAAFGSFTEVFINESGLKTAETNFPQKVATAAPAPVVQASENKQVTEQITPVATQNSKASVDAIFPAASPDAFNEVAIQPKQVASISPQANTALLTVQETVKTPTQAATEAAPVEKMAKEITGPMAAKLEKIATPTGGVALSHLPGAIISSPKTEAESAATATETQPAPTVAEQAQPAPVFKLSKDVRQQLDQIRQRQNLAALKPEEEKPAEVATPSVAPSKPQAAKTNTAAMAQLAAYESAAAIQQNPYGNSQESTVDISKSMMAALKKYDALLNGN